MPAHGGPPATHPASSWRASLVVSLLLGLLAAACQPVATDVADVDAEAAGSDATTGEPGEGGGGAPTVPGRPDTASDQLSGLNALLTEQATTAAQWQAGPVPVEIVAELDDGGWTSSTVLYLAPDADRFLLVTQGADGASQQRPTLATLGLQAVTGPALAEVPPLPELALAPVPLAETVADVLAECDADDPVTAVVYTTGAPATWDGERWTEVPAWTATVTVDNGSGAVVDPVTGMAAADPCVAASG